MAAGHGADLEGVDTGHLAGDDDRDAQCAEGHRRSVGDQAQAGGVERIEAEADEQGGGDRHRRAETGGAFEEGPEGEADQQYLQALVAGNRQHRAADHLELAALHRQFVGKTAATMIRRSARDRRGSRSRRRRGHVGGHVEGEDGHRDGQRQGDAAGDVALRRNTARARKKNTIGMTAAAADRPRGIELLPGLHGVGSLIVVGFACDQIGHAPRPVCARALGSRTWQSSHNGKTNLQKRALRLRVERSACQFARLRLLSKDARAGLVAARLWCGERLGTLPLFSRWAHGRGFATKLRVRVSGYGIWSGQAAPSVG